MVKLNVVPAKKRELVLKPNSSAKSGTSIIQTSKISLVPAGKQPIVNPPARKTERGLPIVRAATGFRVRVSNIGYDVKQADLLASFAVIGKVLSCTLKDGTAIVTYDKRQDANTAIDKFQRLHGAG
jgi:hypothetical protein